MTTSTNTARTRRRPAKAPEDKAPAAAAADTRDVARTKRKTKPLAEAGPPSPPSDATAGRAKRKPTKPPAAAAPSTAPSDATPGRAGHKAKKPPAAAAPVITTGRKPKEPPAAAGPAITAADAPAADQPERRVVDPIPEITSSSWPTRARLIDRIERRVAKPQTDAGPATAATIATPASAVAPEPPTGATAPAAAAGAAAPTGTIAAAAPAVAPLPPAGATGGVMPVRPLGRVVTPPAEAAPAIGTTATRLFDCPTCARPLANGTSRCPGCGVRLIRGVALRRVGGFVAAGITVGVIVVGGLTAASMAVGGQARPAAVATAPSTVPSTPTPRPTPSVAAVPVGPPAGALAALSGTAVVNGRITVDAATLAATLSRKSATTIEVARALRALAADAALGLDLTGRLAPWTDAASVMTKLDDFYRTTAQTARAALRASLGDASAYRSAGAEMLKVLDGLDEVDSASRALAATVALEMPPLVVPD